MGAQREDEGDFSLPSPVRLSQLFEVDEISTQDPDFHHSDPPVLAPKEWRKDALALIHQLSHDVIDVTLVSPILKDIASVITSAFPITFACIETYDDQEIEFTTMSFSNEAVRTNSIKAVAPLNNTLDGEVLRRNSTLILSDANKHDHHVCPSYPEPFQIYHYSGVPLIVDGKTRGVLSIAT